MRRLIGKIIYKFSFATFLPRYINGSIRTRVGIIHKDEILLSKTMISPQQWNLLGGGKEKHETLEQCAIREVKEESGIELKSTQLTHLGKLRMNIKKYNYTLEIFKAELKNKPTIKYPKKEILTMRWYKINNLPSNTHIVVKKLIKNLDNA